MCGSVFDVGINRYVISNLDTSVKMNVPICVYVNMRYVLIIPVIQNV